MRRAAAAACRAAMVPRPLSTFETASKYPMTAPLATLARGSIRASPAHGFGRRAYSPDPLPVEVLNGFDPSRMAGPLSAQLLESPFQSTHAIFESTSIGTGTQGQGVWASALSRISGGTGEGSPDGSPQRERPSTLHGRPIAHIRGVPPSGRSDGEGTLVHRGTTGVRNGANRAEWRPDGEQATLGTARDARALISLPRSCQSVRAFIFGRAWVWNWNGIWNWNWIFRGPVAGVYVLGFRFQNEFQNDNNKFQKTLFSLEKVVLKVVFENDL